jgi:uncharacterized protein (UPF0276 family)
VDTARWRSLREGALGIGLRRPHFQRFLEDPPGLDFVEIITENFLGEAPYLRRVLDRVASRYPIVLHGVSLGLLGHEALDERYLDDVRSLADRVDAPFVSDHLCWTGSHGRSHHDLLPVPFVDDLVDLAAARIAHVQRRLGRPFAIENVSSYVAFRTSTMDEWEFVARVIEEADCGLLLDVNNVLVSATNHGFDPARYLEALDWARVVQLHVAGHAEEPSGLRIDTHDRAAPSAVWALHADACRRAGRSLPTSFEWDERIPPLETVLSELARAPSSGRSAP